MSDFSAIMTFSFTAQTPEIRSMLDKKGDAWFVASDICDILDLDNNREACRKLDEDEKLVSEIMTSGQSREVILVNLSGLFNLVSRSNKPQAKAFGKWLRSDLLPKLYKQGFYGINIPNTEPEDMTQAVARWTYLQRQKQGMNEHKKMLAAAEKVCVAYMQGNAEPYFIPADRQLGLSLN